VNGYSEVPTRARLDGVIDKLVLVEASADATAHDREFAEFVLSKVAKAGSGADEQAAAWCEYVESLPYRRERGEVLRDPRLVVGSGGRPATGGDCDDLVLVVLAGCKSLDIPCQAEIMAKDDGWGFHIRARVGFPPMNPQMWCIVDPVWRSEREWAMIDKIDLKDTAIAKKTQWFSPSAKSPKSPSSSKRNWSIPLVMLGIGTTLYVLRRKFFRS